MTIRALIADDEAYGRRAMLDLLRGASDVEVVAECGNGDEVLARVAAGGVDAVFLDVQMPGRDGLATARELLGRPSTAPPPQIVFVTAFDRHAVEAFEFHAVDYLLKPVAPDRFERTLARLRAQLDRGDGRERSLDAVMQALQQLTQHRAAAPRRIRVEAAGRTLLLTSDDFTWAESQGNYVRLHGGDSPILLRMTLTQLEQQLADCDVIRAHRTCLVNARRVREVRATDGGNTTQLRLDDATLVRVGRAYRAAVLAALRDTR